ncbi:MAG TPA: tyrosine-type recombinase/integrase [Ilumatobacter sp.]|nr:tyrosine-type recombinase/integrase [Ilumatobacter sp.]
MSGRVYAYWREVDQVTGKPRTRKAATADAAPNPRAVRWAYEFMVDDPTGEHKRKSIGAGGFTSKQAAQKARNLKAGEIEADGPAAAAARPSTMTLAAFLDEWLAATKAARRPGPNATLAGMIKSYVKPRLGGVQLRHLTARQISELYDDLAARGGRPRRDADGNLMPRPLSAQTVLHVHKMLTASFRWGVKHRYLRDNPAALVEVRRPERSEAATWSTADVRKFLEHVRGDRLAPLWTLAISTGARRGELLALRWSDVDDDRNVLHIRRSRTLVYEPGRGEVVVEGAPKTDKSRRHIELDDALAGVLRTHRAAQNAERLAWGEAWAGDRTDPYVFTAEDGQPWRPDMVTKMFKRAVVAAGLPWVRLHGMRHTAATILLEAGESPKVVQERLGHATIGETMDRYSHVIEGMQRQASSAIAAAMGLGS